MPPTRSSLGRVACSALLALGAGGCGNDVGQGGRDLGAGGGADLAPPPVDAAAAPCGPTQPCPGGARCYRGRCIPDVGPCNSDDQCTNDTFCACAPAGDGGPCNGVCVPWTLAPQPFDPGCHAGFPTAEFVAPTLKCSWEHGEGVVATPLVADLDGDHLPEIIFSTLGHRLVAIHGHDCSPYFSRVFSFDDYNESQLAVADLDGDHVPEIIGVDSTFRVVVFDSMGHLLATAPTPVGQIGYGGPAIVDVDNQAPPEIVVGAQVLRYLPGPGQPVLTVLWTAPVPGPAYGSLTIAADLDGDSRPEVIAAAASATAPARRASPTATATFSPTAARSTRSPTPTTAAIA